MVWIWDTNWCVWSPKDLHSIAVTLLWWLEGESPWAQSSCTSPATPQTGSNKCIAAHQNMLTCKYILIMIIVSKTPFKHQSFNITLNYLNIWKYPSWMTSEVDSPCAGCSPPQWCCFAPVSPTMTCEQLVSHEQSLDRATSCHASCLYIMMLAILVAYEFHISEY